MFFHLRRVYDALTGGASAGQQGQLEKRLAEERLESVFAAAKRMVPEVFINKKALAGEPEIQARFEVMAVLLAAVMPGLSENEGRALLEAFMGRVELGLREAGVGDMGVGRRVKAFAGALNGRLRRYGALIVAENRGGLDVALAEHHVAGAAVLARELIPDVKKGVARGERLG